MADTLAAALRKVEVRAVAEGRMSASHDDLANAALAWFRQQLVSEESVRAANDAFNQRGIMRAALVAVSDRLGGY